VETLKSKCVCVQEELPQISHSELTDVVIIGDGGYGVVYRAKHARFGTVAYKELRNRKLGDRYSNVVLVQHDYVIIQFLSKIVFYPKKAKTI